MTARPSKEHDFEVLESEPLCGGPPLERLAASVLTPVRSFFVRSHGAVPTVDARSYRLSVGGLVGSPLRLSLGDLRTFPRREIEATLPCAGLRRRELEAVAPVPGELLWDSQAVGNALWQGVALADVLRAAGIAAGAAHVCFEGLDVCQRNGSRFGFGGSIPLEKALAEEVLVADAMNGELLAPEHGYPLRALVPGFIGARSVKWLASIEVRAEPSSNYFQQQAYRLLPRDAQPGQAAGPMLGAFDINVVVTSPRPLERVAAGSLEVTGFAFAGGNRQVARVEASSDGGTTWHDARLERRARWAWTPFAITVPVRAGPALIAVRAQDDSGTVMPERLDQVWNAKGYATNAWYRVSVTAH